VPFAAAMVPAALLDRLPHGWLGAAMFFVAWAVVSLAVVWVFDRVLRARAAKTTSKVDDIVANAVRLPLFAGLLLTGAWVLATSFGLLPDAWSPAVGAALFVGVVVAGAFATGRILTGVLHHYAHRKPSFQAVAGALEFAARVLVWAVALMLVLAHLGIAITPLLGALGIAGLAVALALQDTLANFFAGMYISLDRPLREGEFVEVDGGGLGLIRGTVMDVGWRSVRIVEQAGNMFVMPNSRVAGGIIKNYDRPAQGNKMRLGFRVPYGPGLDLERVEQVILEAAREALAANAALVLKGTDAEIEFQALDDDGVTLELVCRVRGRADEGKMRHALVKAIHARCQAEDIDLGAPRRVVEARAAGGDGDRPERTPSPALGGGSARASQSEDRGR